MNPEYIKISDSRRLLLNRPDKIKLKSIDKYVALSNFSIYYTLENIKKHAKTKNLKYLGQRRIEYYN